MNAPINCSISIEEQILKGLQAGVFRHWTYTKEFLNIKPEYLLTVSVAEALTDGFDSISGMEIVIRLEEPTHNAIYTLMSEMVGLQSWISGPRPSVSRTGKIDLFVSTEQAHYAIEMKGFDPSATEITKELLRLQELLSLNDGLNNLISTHVAFPTQIDQTAWINKHVKLSVDATYWKHDINTVRHETNEDPEDGIPCYYANCISILRK